MRLSLPGPSSPLQCPPKALCRSFAHCRFFIFGSLHSSPSKTQRQPLAHLASRKGMGEPEKTLPRLGPTPIRHPDCCLSLSTTLFDSIITATSGERVGGDGARVVLSVGSGSGLLEHLLMLHAENSGPDGSWLVEGVEVQQPESQPSVNKYLSEPHYHTVQRTSTISPRLYHDGVQGLMFVYPRQPSLVSQYLAELGGRGSCLDTVIWLGPRADWRDFSACFDPQPSSKGRPPREITVLSGTEAGLDDYELMAIVRLHRAADH